MALAPATLPGKMSDEQLLPSLFGKLVEQATGSRVYYIPAYDCTSSLVIGEKL